MEKKIRRNIAMTTASLAELRAHCEGLECEQRERVFAAALDVSDLEPSEACLLAVVQRCAREDHGIDTPIEEFICDLLRKFLFRAPDLDDVERVLDEFRLNWNDCLKNARRFYVDHRELVTAASANE